MNRADLKGITAANCPDACRDGRCVISTTEFCKHPNKSGDGGCGPVTLANRDEARKVIKINAIEGDGNAEREPGTARVHGNVENGGRAKKAPRARKKAGARKRRQRVHEGGQGPEDRPAGEAREGEEIGAA